VFKIVKRNSYDADCGKIPVWGQSSLEEREKGGGGKTDINLEHPGMTLI
jgi:hypothetical protein